MGRGAREAALADLIAAAGPSETRGRVQLTVSGVSYDSRRVAPGDLFCAVSGLVADGHDFAPEAAAGGASALLVERWIDEGAAAELSQVKVESVRATMAPVAAAFWGRPSEKLALAGVTGTNGKTSTVYMIDSIFRAAGRVTGMTGTIETYVAGEAEPVERTTPESPDLQALLARMVEAGVEVAAMEVSSHALALDRVAATLFRVGVFTNLSQDHLDFHRSMDEYYEAKRSFFDPDICEQAVINLDNEWTAPLAGTLEIPVTTFSLDPDAGADLWAEAVELGPEGSRFILAGAAGRREIWLRMRGLFSVANALAAAGVALVLGAAPSDIASGLEAVAVVPGRFEAVDRGQGFLAVVDYAHTPESVESVLGSARALCAGRLIVVLGCGGDRDRAKRPLMARAAADGADVAIFTSDNPRREDPGAILGDMREGVNGSAALGRYEIEPDRRLAIRRAIETAEPGDVVVVAGKGHETGQQFSDRIVPFDDRLVLAEELDRVVGGAGGGIEGAAPRGPGAAAGGPSAGGRL